MQWQFQRPVDFPGAEFRLQIEARGAEVWGAHVAQVAVGIESNNPAILDKIADQHHYWARLRKLKKSIERKIGMLEIEHELRHWSHLPDYLSFWLPRSMFERTIAQGLMEDRLATDFGVLRERFDVLSNKVTELYALTDSSVRNLKAAALLFGGAVSERDIGEIQLRNSRL